MKFCKHCGSQIPDDAVCNCPGAVAERQGQGGYQAPYQQQQQVYYQQPVYAAAGQGKSFGQKLVEPFTLYFKNPKKAVNNRIKDKDFITPLIYIATLFIILIGVCCCVYGIHAAKGVVIPGEDSIKVDTTDVNPNDMTSVMKAMTAMSAAAGVSQSVDFNFGLCVLAAFILTVGMCAAYVLSRFIITMAIGKKPVNPGDVFINGMISFGVNSIIPLVLMIVGGLFYMLTSLVGAMFFIAAAVWYIIANVLELKDNVDYETNGFVKLLVTALVIGAFTALFFLLYQAMFAMNVKVVDVTPESLTSNYGKYSSYGSYGSFRY